jgi:hypothetical protein
MPTPEEMVDKESEAIKIDEARDFILRLMEDPNLVVSDCKISQTTKESHDSFDNKDENESLDAVLNGHSIIFSSWRLVDKEGRKMDSDASIVIDHGNHVRINIDSGEWSQLYSDIKSKLEPFAQK